MRSNDVSLRGERLLYDSERFVAVDKPAGWLSVPSRLGEHDQRPCVGKRLEEELGCRLWPVHRLDQEVTGLLLFAKAAAAHKVANRWFEERLVHKTYEALTQPGRAATYRTEGEGTRDEAIDPASLRPGQEFVWRCQLARGKRRAYLSAQGKPSETKAVFVQEAPLPAGRGDSWQLQPRSGSSLQVGRGYLWRLQPVSGRPHQLRFELSRHGFPIVGDVLYGATAAFAEGEETAPGEAIALRCVSLAFADCPERASVGLPLELRASGWSLVP